MADVETLEKDDSKKDLENEAEKDTFEVQPLKARIFAEDLVEFILQKFGYSWVFDRRVRQLPRYVLENVFHDEVGDAVYDLFSCHINDISNAYRNMQKSDIKKMRAFRKQLCITGESYLNGNYDPINFLVMAGSFIGVAVLYFHENKKENEKENEVLLATVQVLAYLLNKFICEGKFDEKLDAKGDWFKLAVSAQEIRLQLFDRKFKSDYVFPDFSLDKLV